MTTRTRRENLRKLTATGNVELRHDFRMKALEQRARWLDERKP